MLHVAICFLHCPLLIYPFFLLSFGRQSPGDYHVQAKHHFPPTCCSRRFGTPMAVVLALAAAPFQSTTSTGELNWFLDHFWSRNSGKANFLTCILILHKFWDWMKILEKYTKITRAWHSFGCIPLMITLATYRVRVWCFRSAGHLFFTLFSPLCFRFWLV